MFDVSHSSVWYPPHFPLGGRLPSSPAQVYQNLRRQGELEERHHDELSIAAGYPVMPPCCKTLHLSLFFDGTGNNLNSDLLESATPHPTNIARLFRATIGAGHAGGTAHLGQNAPRFTDAADVGHGQYYKYYMPGVGAPFAEIGDLDYGKLGLAGAWYGEERINWALLMIIDALRRCLGRPRLDNDALRATVKAMGTWAGFESVNGRTNRSREFERQLKAIEKPLRIALTQPQPGLSKLLGLKLYVYGFSRGAAAARAFVSWLNELMRTQSFLALGDLKIPVTVEFLGLLDTVASVGFADILPGANSHMSWADGNQELPVSGLVKRCLHLVASHEQRLSFPLESIRRQSGEYPANCLEVMYPGVHSDIGGGYPPGDQGKAVGLGDGLLLSQIAMNDLYADAYAHGAPLKTPEMALPTELRHEQWRKLDIDLSLAFETLSTLVVRFNAWRELTLGLRTTLQSTDTYYPVASSVTVDQALQTQLNWLTAWRIDRYAFASLKQTRFYKLASDTHADPVSLSAARTNRDHPQAAIEKRRTFQISLEQGGLAEKRALEPGIADFDPDMARTQLCEAAEEFTEAYRSSDRLKSSLRQLAPACSPPAFVLHIITADVRAEGQRMKAAAQALVSRLFPPQVAYGSQEDEQTRGLVDEQRNAEAPEGLLRALFDDQVHDSRAWFLYSLGREPMGSYFRERMVFFGEASRRELALYGESDTAQIASVTMDAEHLAQVHQSIDALWDSYYAQTAEAPK